jgi:trimethylamine--corrinoid protein Co-methyltransferase
MQASENCQSLEKLVVDNEYCGAAYRLAQGITVDEVSLAVEVIGKVGPGGHFLAEKHTRQNLRKERFMPSDVLDRLSPDAWVKAGSRDTTSRAQETANRILDEHEPDPLSKEAAQELRETLGGILERYGISLSNLPAI